jgi:hypothetical protein
MTQIRLLLLAGALAGLLATPLYAPAAARPAGIATTNDLSAQANNKKDRQGATVAKPAVTNKVVRHRTTVTTIKPKSGNAVTKKTTTTIKTVTPKGGNATIKLAPKGPPRAVTFSGPRVVIGGHLRGVRVGTGRYVVHGRNYSYWRGGPYRVRYGNGWRTFVAIGALTAIAVGTTTYYPYAYISAPQDTCDGLTEDGCQMTWQDVETVEGGTASQCVAYCPWQE